ncbi:MAG: replication protein P [Halioglobus sp.]
MQDKQDLVKRAARAIEASSKTSTTPAGQTESTRASATEGHIDALNQVFALFRLNYHNQYYAAYPDNGQVNQIKKLWLESLTDYPVEQILRGAKHAIENSEYLPTLNRMHECCQQGLSDFGLPTAHAAYVEACNASSPKSAQAWSHPAVYLAGRDSDWFFLANNVERVTWPFYRDHYQRYCARVMRGEELAVPEPEALERDEVEPLSKEEQLAELRRLREETGV